ncbi:histidine phosphatase superfamily [Schizothecium vesticola]|uniref:Histidine phosphatase superfamily n=1 Tax=Schizothecium vesticola TaxID=314040 RepID=A0AA40KCE9_9PEZI|nr:histidine phosphatase superfamily [Schizothecium vesticola]
MLTSATLLSLLAGTAVAETVHGVVVFTRHGDRTTKHYGAQSLTSLGATQNFQVGSDYRVRYLAAGSPHQIAGISESKYISSQIYATAPNSGILLNTATAFLQGLYPPLVDLAPASQILSNGTKSTSPLNGYQYVTLQGVKDNSPDTIWIKGDESCPTLDASLSALESSPHFTSLVASTRPFYESFYPALQSVSSIRSPSSLSFASAYDIFDLLNVARIHNTSTTASISDANFFQLRTLADAAEFAHSYDAADAARSTGARTFAGAVLAQLTKTVTSAGALKFSLLAGSYDTFLGFAGLADLTAASADFFGLPEYASTMAFELFSAAGGSTGVLSKDDLHVRFLFRNGTEGALTAFPLFGGKEESLGWAEFEREMQARAITTVEGWCSACRSEVDFCKVYGEVGAKKEGGMSTAVAGVVGAAVTLGVVALVGGFVFMMVRRRGSRGEKGGIPAQRLGEKGSVRSFTSEVTV